MPHPSSSPETTDVTALLQQWRAGDLSARDQIFQVLYPLLRLRALAVLRGGAGCKLSLSATDLLHESYARIVDQRSGFANRAHFLALASQSLRRVLLDLIRGRAAEKRGGEYDLVSIDWLDADQSASPQSPLHLTQLINGLEQLQRRDPEAAQVLELRLLGGLSNEEAAEVIGISVATAGRRFAFARAWLAR